MDQNLLEVDSYISPLELLQRKHHADVQEAAQGSDKRLLKQMPYRTDQRFFASMRPRRDFKERGTIVFREYSYQN